MLKPIKKANLGFTIIELLVTMAIIAVIASLGIAQFNSYKANAYRASVQLMTHDLQGAVEGVLIGRLMEIGANNTTEIRYESSKGINAAALVSGTVTGAPVTNPGPFPDIYVDRLLPHIIYGDNGSALCYRLDVRFNNGGTPGAVNWSLVASHQQMAENQELAFTGVAGTGTFTSTWEHDIEFCAE